LTTVPADAAAMLRARHGRRPIAEHTDAANAQHYELPAAFFEVVLGPNLKYSSGLYPKGRGDLALGEVEALRETETTPTCATARILGARLRLGLAVAVDGSALPQFSDHLGLQLGLPARLHRSPRRRARPDNLTVVTADMNDFSQRAWVTSASTAWCQWRCSSTCPTGAPC
jgi:cyclopropane-fatty-acyl-phospholipid synthase